jgi:hypothetical protein
MVMAATKEDATLMVQILQWGTALGVNEAFAQIHSDDFEPDKVDTHNPDVRKVLNFYELVGTLVKQRLLDRDLVYDLWAVDETWKRVGPAALKVRERSGIARMYENMEALAQGAPTTAGV